MVASPSLPELETLIVNRRRTLTFPPNLERLYEIDRAARWAERSLSTVVRGAITYDLFVVVDFLFLPKTAWLAFTLRLFVISPLMILLGKSYQYPMRPWLRESTAAAVPVLMAAQSLLIYRLNSGMAADIYQFAAMTIMIYSNLVVPILFRAAVIGSVLITALFVLAVATSGNVLPAKVMGIMYMLSALQAVLLAKYRMEWLERDGFLRSLRDNLRRDAAETDALLDPLTGLANRRALPERLATLWAAPAPVAVAMVDVDHFKSFNDRYGHQAGDQCLKRVAGTLNAGLRGPGDLAVRYGGEEFVLLLPDLTLAEACAVAERVRRNIEGLGIPHEVAAHIVTASIGVCAGWTSEQSAEMMLARADAALYEAKARGRNQVSPRIAGAAPEGWLAAC